MTSLAFLSMSMEQSDMYHAMQERTHERLEGWNVNLLDRFFDPRYLHYETYIGLFQWSCPAIMVKWLYRPHALNLGGGYVTPGDIARDYLALKYPKRRIRCTTSQWKSCIESRNKAPTYSKPGQLERGIYLDLSGAYWQITRAVGWDVEYNPERWLISRSRMTDFPFPREKMARNCLVSVGMPGAIRLWTGKELQFIQRPNRFVNLILWRLVNDVLNGIAADMLAIGAIYINTDGYILTESDEQLGFEVLDSWGLIGKVKRRGVVDVKAVAAYKFVELADNGNTTSTFQTKPYVKNRRPMNVSRINSPNREWLRKRFRGFAQIALQEWEYYDGQANDPVIEGEEL